MYNLYTIEALFYCCEMGLGISNASTCLASYESNPMQLIYHIARMENCCNAYCGWENELNSLAHVIFVAYCYRIVYSTGKLFISSGVDSIYAEADQHCPTALSREVSNFLNSS